jgi:hypothetical protein
MKLFHQRDGRQTNVGDSSMKLKGLFQYELVTAASRCLELHVRDDLERQDTAKANLSSESVDTSNIHKGFQRTLQCRMFSWHI